MALRGFAFVAHVSRTAAERAVPLFEDLLRRDPHYPGAVTSLHCARVKAGPNAFADRQALRLARDRKPSNGDIVRMVDEVDPATPFITERLSPGDAAASYGRAMLSEFAAVMRCCGRGASLSLTILSRYPEASSARIAFDFAMRDIGASGAQLNIDVDSIPQPDPRQNKGRVDLPIWQWQNDVLTPMYAQGHPQAQQAVGTIAYQVFRKDAWDPAAHAIATGAGPQALHAFLSVLTNPPQAPDDFNGFAWTYRCQIAAALVVSHMGPWESGPARTALYSLISGPSDWTTIAGIVALSFRAGDSPAIRTEVEGAFRWLRSLIPPTGFTPWELALVECWLALENHPEPFSQEFLAWRAHYIETVEEKNSVQTQRKYGGLPIEQYAEFSSERDKLQGNLSYGGVASAMNAAFNPSPPMITLGQRFGVPNPGNPFVIEWQEALNANSDLMQEFIEARRTYELGQMGVNSKEKGALDNILAGNMDMHHRMAQAQMAQAEVSSANRDPDPPVFPGQPVARLSNYVKIMKGIQQGNMMGALAAYRLDVMSYGQVATAWGAKMAADPTLPEKFSRMMAS